MSRKRINTIFVIGLVAGIVSCDPADSPFTGYDRTALLQNLGNNIIVPSYVSLQVSVNELQVATTAFTELPDVTKLDAIRNKFIDAYKRWQRCGYYGFGPADDIFLTSSVNTFPTSKNDINTSVASGSYNLNAASSADEKGFPALDYLLYGTGDTDDAIVDLYVGDASADNRKQYLEDVVADIKSKVDAVVTAWSSSGGNYIADFISRGGTDVGSATGMLINALNLYNESDVRDKKIGIPLGIRSLGIPIPSNCEALYSVQSIALAHEGLLALQHLFDGGSGTGFDDYLDAINAKYDGSNLSDVIQQQIQSAIDKVVLIPEPYAETVEANPDPASAAYQELQKLVVLLKTDLPSSTGILITYQDNDGD
jgi:predicted lipoprotein